MMRSVFHQDQVQYVSAKQNPQPAVIVQPQPQVVVQPQMQPQPFMQPQVAVVQQPQAVAFVIPKTGFMRLHFMSAHLDINRGGMLNKMDPFVFVRVGKGQEWRSQVCVNGGKNPSWNHQHMEIPVKKLGKLDKNVHIEVRDQNMLNSEPLGHANITLGLFASRGPIQERVTLMFQGRPSGHLMMRSTFEQQGGVAVVQQQPQVTVVQNQPQPQVMVQPNMQSQMQQPYDQQQQQ